MDFDLMISSFPKLLSATLVTLKLISASLLFGIFSEFYLLILEQEKIKFLSLSHIITHIYLE